MRCLALFVVLSIVLAGCSFVGVRAATRTTEPVTDPSSIRCTTSDVLPAVDAIGGAAAIAVAGGGVILEHASDSGEPKHFTAYYAGPLLLLAIAYFWSGSYGTDHVERCNELKGTGTQAD